MREITVVSCNMHMGVPAGMPLAPQNERRGALSDIAAFLEETRADVVLLQEVRNDAVGSRPGGVPRQLWMLEELSKATGSAYCTTVSLGNGDAYGLAVLTRRGVEIVDHTCVRLPNGPSSEPRVLLVTQLEVDGEPFVAVDLHLDFSAPERFPQLVEAERVLQALLEGREVEVLHADGTEGVIGGLRGPLIVGGDFNDAAETVAMAMARTQLVNIVDGLDHEDPLRADTHPHGGRIDHVLLGPGMDVLEQHLVDIPKRTLRDGEAVTDHLSIVVRVAFRPSTEFETSHGGATYAAAAH